MSRQLMAAPSETARRKNTLNDVTSRTPNGAMCRGTLHPYGARWTFGLAGAVTVTFAIITNWETYAILAPMAKKWTNKNLPGALHFVTGNCFNRTKVFEDERHVCCFSNQFES